MGNQMAMSTPAQIAFFEEALASNNGEKQSAALNADIATYLPEDLLTLLDRTSMAVSVERMLDSTPADRGASSSRTEKVPDEEYQPLEFKIGRMGMGYDEETDQFVFVVHDVDVLAETLEKAAEASAEEAGEDGEDLEEGESLEDAFADIEATMSFRAGRRVLADMCRQAREVCMGGRPICPLCNQPIDPKGHICPRTNGHHPPAERNPR